MKCNFKFECDQGEDEAGCPMEFDFDDCATLSDCFWNEEQGDELDWILTNRKAKKVMQILYKITKNLARHD